MKDTVIKINRERVIEKQSVRCVRERRATEIETMSERERVCDGHKSL